MSLGENIRRIRREKGLTQYNLSNKTGIKVGHISTLEAEGADPKLSTIYKLMEGLGCSANALMMDPDKMNTDEILTTVLERVMMIPEENKRHLIDVIDKYCIACGVEKFFNPENVKWSEPRFRIMTEANKPVIRTEGT